MPLDPQVEALLNEMAAQGAKPFEELSVAEARVAALRAVAKLHLSCSVRRRRHDVDFVHRRVFNRDKRHRPGLTRRRHLHPAARGRDTRHGL